MLILLSPAKTLDFSQQKITSKATTPVFLKQSNELASILKKLSYSELAILLEISDQLAQINFARYQNWENKPSDTNSKQAIFAFNGDVYEGLQAKTLNTDEIDFAQNHLRILSGIYGILSPLDLIQPHRLEMGTKLINASGNNLYQYWSNKITDQVIKSLDETNSKTILNLASNEYFKSINQKKLKCQIIQPVFKDFKNGEFKMISFYAKKARGLMARYIIQNRISRVEKIKEFNLDGYLYNDNLSKPNAWTFTRDH